MQHYFDVEFATEYGILEAILFQNIAFWIEKNRANDKQYFDGKYWTYNSTRAFQQLFPYASAKKINNALANLIDAGLLEVGNYNKSAYDRTRWFALTEKAYSIITKGKMEESKRENGNAEKGKPIPDNKPDTNPFNNKDSKGKAARFTPPTLEELQQYIAENGFVVDAAYFFDYYTANGWIAGKNKMKDWRATVRNWNRRENKKPQQQKKIAYDTSTELPF
jgi:hypothetical protein